MDNYRQWIQLPTIGWQLPTIGWQFFFGPFSGSYGHIEHIGHKRLSNKNLRYSNQCINRCVLSIFNWSSLRRQWIAPENIIFPQYAFFRQNWIYSYPLYFYGNRGYNTLYNLSLEACNAFFCLLSMGKHAPSRLIT